MCGNKLKLKHYFCVWEKLEGTCFTLLANTTRQKPARVCPCPLIVVETSVFNLRTLRESSRIKMKGQNNLCSRLLVCEESNAESGIIFLETGVVPPKNCANV